MEFAPGFQNRLITQPGVIADPDEAMFPVFELALAQSSDVIVSRRCRGTAAPETAWKAIAVCYS